MPTTSPGCTASGSRCSRVSSHRIGFPNETGVAEARTNIHRGVITAVPKEASLGFTRCTFINVKSLMRQASGTTQNAHRGANDTAYVLANRGKSRAMNPTKVINENDRT